MRGSDDRDTSAAASAASPRGELFTGDFPDDDFDVIVIGSGFGGSVSAYVLAARGQRVCLLERGKAFPPGSFARTPSEISRNLWDPSEGLHGMFNVWSFKGIDALTASGVGGGSLIYANVMLRKDPEWFVQHHPYRAGEYEPWPISREDLDPHYDAVSKFLDVQMLPDEAAVPKTRAMLDAARRMGMADSYHLAPLAVRFRGAGGTFNPGEPLEADEYPSIFGTGALARRTCRLCGECDVGCNDGAKSTLDHTYISAAAHEGAVISMRSEVTALRRREKAFEVDFVVHRPEREGRRTDTDFLPIRTLTARRVVLGAGSIGTTYLLLRNRKALRLANPALGTRFCGNGDFLGFILKSQRDGQPFPLEGSRGPVISSYIRWPDNVETGDPADFGMYLEDAGFPAFIQWLVEASQVPAAARRAAIFTYARIKERFSGQRKSLLSGELSRLLGAGALSQSSLPLLAMGRDIPDGRLYLNEGGRSKWLDSSWNTKTSLAYFDHVKKQMKAVADALNGRFEVNPHYLLNRVITVHSLGGSPMSNDPDQGVVDRYGEVYGVPGLYVADGAAMPGPVGANPSLTIAAFARWMCDHMPVGRVAA